MIIGRRLGVRQRSAFCLLSRLVMLNAIEASDLERYFNVQRNGLIISASPRRNDRLFVAMAEALERRDDRFERWMVVERWLPLISIDHALSAHCFATLKFCSKCISNGDHFVQQQLPFVRHCEIHRLPLRTSCPDCGKALRGNDVSAVLRQAFACECGAQFAEATTLLERQAEKGGRVNEVLDRWESHLAFCASNTRQCTCVATVFDTAEQSELIDVAVIVGKEPSNELPTSDLLATWQPSGADWIAHRLLEPVNSPVTTGLRLPNLMVHSTTARQEGWVHEFSAAVRRRVVDAVLSRSAADIGRSFDSDQRSFSQALHWWITLRSIELPVSRILNYLVPRFSFDLDKQPDQAISSFLWWLSVPIQIETAQLLCAAALDLADLPGSGGRGQGVGDSLKRALLLGSVFLVQPRAGVAEQALLVYRDWGPLISHLYRVMPRLLRRCGREAVLRRLAPVLANAMNVNVVVSGRAR